MLLTCLQGQDKPLLAIQINSPSDNPSRHLAHKILTTAHETKIGTTRREWCAQRLTVTTGNVGTGFTPFPRWR